MSFLPILLDDMLNDFRRPFTFGNLYDRHYGMGLDELAGDVYSSDLSSPTIRTEYTEYVNPWGCPSLKDDEKVPSSDKNEPHTKLKTLKRLASFNWKRGSI